MVDISIVTSLFRSDEFLPAYVRVVSKTAAALHKAGVSLEVVIVANDASPNERSLIEKFIAGADTFRVVPLYVLRESVYASWNRGIQASGGRVIGFWNADDIRDVGALIEAHQSLSASGNRVIYFPYTVVWIVRWWKLAIPWKHLHPALPFSRERFSRKMKAGPFFMFTREVYNEVGPFDSRFKIVGDLEWATRAMGFTDFYAGKEHSGQLVVHGSNLSGVWHPLENVEKNMIYLMHGMPEEIMPADPDLMHQVWNEWNIQGVTLSDATQEKLWGKNAADDWRKWQVEQQKAMQQVRISQIVRFVPRWLVKKLGLRGILNRMTILKSS
jgi:glycosyltransferase involved in cell wall biosynthesis